MSGGSSRTMTFPTTGCTTRAIRALAAGPARRRSLRAATSVPDGGPGQAGRSAACTSSRFVTRVDIVSTIRRGDGDTISQVILTNVLLLTVDERGRSREGKLSEETSDVVIVALNHRDALRA